VTTGLRFVDEMPDAAFADALGPAWSKMTPAQREAYGPPMPREVGLSLMELAGQIELEAARSDRLGLPARARKCLQIAQDLEQLAAEDVDCHPSEAAKIHQPKALPGSWKRIA
jgi:hypothetical protein